MIRADTDDTLLETTQGAHDDEAHALHSRLAEAYRETLLDHHQKRGGAVRKPDQTRILKDQLLASLEESRLPQLEKPRADDRGAKEGAEDELNFTYELEVAADEDWDYPVLEFRHHNQNPVVPE